MKSGSVMSRPYSFTFLDFALSCSWSVGRSLDTSELKGLGDFQNRPAEAQHEVTFIFSFALLEGLNSVTLSSVGVLVFPTLMHLSCSSSSSSFL